MLDQLRFESQPEPEIANRLKAWKRILEDPALGVLAPQILRADSQVFVLGSCFANEIRAVLETKDVSVHPRMDAQIAALLPDDLKIDPAWGAWDERVHYQCYTPFSILQEVRIAVGAWEPTPDSVLTSKKDGRKAYWDPYRRYVYTHTKADTLTVRETMNRRVREGLEAADVVVFTLGLIESFGIQGHPGVAAEFNLAFRKRLELQDPGYDEALAAMDEACRLVLERAPETRIVLTVSPIPLSLTFTNADVVTATMRGKSILRAVADTLQRRYPNVSYFPSYEFVMWRGDGFREVDQRHVRPEIVAEITGAFCDAWFQPDALAPGDAAYPQHTPRPPQGKVEGRGPRRGLLDTLLGRRSRS
tara:strand:+ start:9354 stop:10436 length:1083 start_codon:yes stop_codon:yes gene_type:complete